MQKKLILSATRLIIQPPTQKCYLSNRWSLMGCSLLDSYIHTWELAGSPVITGFVKFPACQRLLGTLHAVGSEGRVAVCRRWHRLPGNVCKFCWWRFPGGMLKYLVNTEGVLARGETKAWLAQVLQVNRKPQDQTHLDVNNIVSP